jgi:hypothetical protein
MEHHILHTPPSKCKIEKEQKWQLAGQSHLLRNMQHTPEYNYNSTYPEDGNDTFPRNVGNNIHDCLKSR